MTVPARLRWRSVLFLSMVTLLLTGASAGHVLQDDLRSNPADPGSPTGQSPEGSELHNHSPVDTVETIQFEPERGFYSGPVRVRLSCPATQAVILYTTDGSEPTVDHGRIYTEPLRLAATTAVRATVFREGYGASRTTTHTYILDASEAIRSLPVVSLAGDERETFYMPNGICAIRGGEYRSGYVSWHPVNQGDYNHPMGHGRNYERPVSVEMLHADGTPGFQSDCGIRVSGSTYTRSRYRLDSKFSFRLYFRDDYGRRWLDYPFIPNAPVERFRHIVLRAGQTDRTNPFIKDELGRRLQRDISGVACNGTFVNLFINGVYQGYYNPCERIDEEMFQEQYGTAGDWDVVHNWRPEDDDAEWTAGDPVDRPYRFDARDGDMESMTDLLNYALAENLAAEEHYLEINRRLDIVQFIDYLILEGYCNHGDWPHNNWTAARLRTEGPLGRWRFYVWDIEHTFGANWLDGPFKTPSSSGNIQVIGILYEQLRANREFCQCFADRVQRHFFDNGTLQAEHVIGRYEELRAVMAGVLPNMSTYIRDTWADQRPSRALDSLRDKGLFTFAGPRLFINGLPQHGGPIQRGDVLEILNPHGEGTIYYTLDGTDPRLSSYEADRDGAVPPAPTGRILWEIWTGIAGTKISDLTGYPAYPHDPPYSQYLNTFETPIRWADNYGGRIRGYLHPPTTGMYTFWLATDDAGQLYVSSDHHPSGATLIATVDGWAPPYDWDKYASQKSPQVFLEAGKAYYIEALQKDGTGGDHLMVAWEGPGFERQIIDGAFLSEYEPVTVIPRISDTAEEYRRPVVLSETTLVSARILKEDVWSGLVEARFDTMPAVRINEIMADNENTIEDPDEINDFPDWLELHNPSTVPVDLEGMYLTDDPNKPHRYRINEPVTIAPGGFILFWADDDTEQGVLHTNFNLDKAGETVTLYDRDGKTVIDTITFPALEGDVSYGRFPDATGDPRRLAPTPGQPNIEHPLMSLDGQNR